MGFQEEVSAALGALGAKGCAVMDAIADPGGAARALEGDRVVLRAAPPLGPAAEGYAPDPASPVWVRLTRGAREVTVVPLCGGEKVERRAADVEVEKSLERCCDAPSCALQKCRVAVWLELEGGGAPTGRLLIAEQRTPEGAPPAAVHVVAHRLRSLLGLPASPSEEGEESAGDPLPDALGELPPGELARFALRSEGSRVVLRDYASEGPRSSAPRNTLIGVLLMLIAGLSGAELAASLRGDSTGITVAFGALTALFTLAGVAFLGVARYSARYRAASAPLLALGQGRFIVMPWVSRSGAVDLRPEGRLGAAIPLGELRGVSVQRRGARRAVELDGDHGPMDALSTDREEIASFWSGAVSRIAAEVRHPKAGASARQRARRAPRS